MKYLNGIQAEFWLIFLLQDKMKESEVVLNGVQAEIGKLEQEENDLQKDVVDVRHELERIEGIVKSNKLKVKHWRKEVTDLYPLGGGVKRR